MEEQEREWEGQEGRNRDRVAGNAAEHEPCILNYTSV